MTRAAHLTRAKKFGSVLRLRKAPKQTAEPGDEEVGDDGDESRFAKQRALAERLEAQLGRRYRHVCHRVRVTRAFCDELNENAAPLRPAKRRDKSIDGAQRCATLLLDVTRCFSRPDIDQRLFANNLTVTVEIKVCFS